MALPGDGWNGCTVQPCRRDGDQADTSKGPLASPILTSRPARPPLQSWSNLPDATAERRMIERMSKSAARNLDRLQALAAESGVRIETPENPPQY